MLIEQQMSVCGKMYDSINYMNIIDDYGLLNDI